MGELRRYILIERRNLSAIQETSIRAHIARLGIAITEYDGEDDDTEKAQVVERLRIMAKQRTSSQMDEEEREGADWQGAYDWFCDESRAIYAVLTDTKADTGEER